jgi:hypothetical protein
MKYVVAYKFHLIHAQILIVEYMSETLWIEINL